MLESLETDGLCLTNTIRSNQYVLEDHTDSSFKVKIRLSRFHDAIWSLFKEQIWVWELKFKIRFRISAKEKCFLKDLIKEKGNFLDLHIEDKDRQRWFNHSTDREVTKSVRQVLHR